MAQDEEYKKFLEHQGRMLREKKETERLVQESYNKHWQEVELPRIKAEHEKMWAERDRKLAGMVECDRVLALKRQLLGAFLKSFYKSEGGILEEQVNRFLEVRGVEDSVRSNIGESILTAREVLEEVGETENVNEILYWAKQG